MKKYALINAENMVVSLIICYHDFKVPADHQKIDVGEQTVHIGDIYNQDTGLFEPNE